MNPPRANPIPLPCAVLALSVAVCIGSVGPAQASAIRPDRGVQADQRETLEHLLDAINEAARRLSDRLDGQAARADRDAIRPSLALCATRPSNADATTPAVTPLRDALLNLPPPVR